MRPHYLRAICLLLAGITIGNAQEPQFEYGSPNELRGITKVYVYTGAELEVRNNIVKIIQKELKQIIVTDRPNDADVYLFYGAAVNTFYAGTWGNSTTTGQGVINGQAHTYGNTTTAQGTYSGQSTTTSSNVPRYRTVVTGSGIVAKIDGSKVRLLLDFHDDRSSVLERRPSTNFARAFVRAYEKANKRTDGK